MSEKEVSWWKRQGRRFQNGMIVSAIWLVGWLTYAIWAKVYCLEPNQIGDFMAGVAAPVAFGWLVLGYMQQGDEIKETRVEIKRQADSIQANEGHARRDLFFEMARQTIEELRQTAFYFCLRFDEANNSEWSSKRTYVMIALQNGYADGAAHHLADYLVQHNGQTHFGALRTRVDFLDVVNRFITDFENLLTSADAAADGDKNLHRFYEGTAIARLYLQLCLRMQRQSILGM